MGCAGSSGSGSGAAVGSGTAVGVAVGGTDAVDVAALVVAVEAGAGVVEGTQPASRQAVAQATTDGAVRTRIGGLTSRVGGVTRPR
ncbi:hypothetical protein GCM10023113_35850 [Cellulomonas oligotrophica]|uniref:Uncharacterized protein n=1 Tax=Cellulomonas oligotrophica TaxID=931536 RepID=A0ABQ4DC88_9CELL|nr:hypothetical protein Col01nite_25020 [Cellulomonas oligotrophica]